MAFIDDNAIAELNWIEELVEVYDESDAITVSGQSNSDWVTDKPNLMSFAFKSLLACGEFVSDLSGG